MYLNKLLTSRGVLPKTEIVDNAKIVDHYTEKIIKELKMFDKQIFSKLKRVKTGSNQEGLKVNRPNEFDVMLVLLNDLEQCLDVKCEKGDALGYAKLRKKGCTALHKFQCFEKYFEEELSTDTEESSTDYFLGSRALMEYFRKGIVAAVGNITKNEDLSHLKVKGFSSNSPAVTVSIIDKKKGPILVDLVLSIRIHGWPSIETEPEWDQFSELKSWPDAATVERCKEEFHLVPKYPPNGRESSNHLLWRISFSSAEMKLMLPKKNGVQKECLKLVKVIFAAKRIFNDFFCSYYVKMAVMNFMMEGSSGADYWSAENLGPRVIDLLVKIRDGFHKKDLRHFFIHSLNLIKDSKIDYVDQISNVIQELQKNPKEFCEEILHSEVI